MSKSAGAVLIGLVVSGYTAQGTARPALTERAHHVAPGDTWVVPATTRLEELSIAPGANITAPDGHSVTLTVDGVETGQALVTTAGVATHFIPGTYRGHIVLTVTAATPVSFAPPGPPGPAQVFPFRQALYLGTDGIAKDRSVPAAITGATPRGFDLQGLSIKSHGQAFNGVYAVGGTWHLDRLQIDFTGNGRSDFGGDGAAVLVTGEQTRLVLDRADIRTHGAVRTAAIATGGSHLIVKHSHLETHSGVLPNDYRPTVDLGQMRTSVWMLGMRDAYNVRATNLLGERTRATYIGSEIQSDGWGALSTDVGQHCTLSAINSHIIIAPGGDGYGTYAIGDATENFLGARFDVTSYATINTGGIVNYGDSSRAAVAALNQSLDLRLTTQELAAIEPRPTEIHSQRFGVMWHSSGGTVNVSGRTRMETGETLFLDKSAMPIAIAVDGAAGAHLHAGNGIVLEVMDDDDPGPQGPGEINNGVYVEPTAAPTRDPSFDVTATAGAAAATFSHISIEGNFYNSSGWTLMAHSGPGAGGPPPGAEHQPKFTPGEQNMALTFDHANITGVISSAEAHHHVARIDSAHPAELGVVNNTPRAAINNGTIVTLAHGSRWTVTGPSYLTKLQIDADASLVAPAGRSVTLTVDGAPTTVAAGKSYTGAILVNVR